MKLIDKKGLKYPDVDIIRYFFKNKLSYKTGKVIEFGCGNGNNLELFKEYGWEVTGVDKFDNHIKDGIYNGFKKTELLTQDMCEYVSKNNMMQYDIIMFPSSLYYLQYDEINNLLANMKIKHNTYVFFKMRGMLDYRAKKADPIFLSTCKINFEETGENGCYNTFYSFKEFQMLLRKYFYINEIKVFENSFDNLMNNIMIYNHDFILWCKLSPK